MSVARWFHPHVHGGKEGAATPESTAGCLKFLTRLLLLAPAHIAQGPRLPPLHASTHRSTTNASLRVVAGAHSQVSYIFSDRLFIKTVKTPGPGDPNKSRNLQLLSGCTGVRAPWRSTARLDHKSGRAINHHFSTGWCPFDL